MKPRLVIADDHAPMLRIVRRILEPEFEVVDSVSDAAALLESVRRLRPDLVVSDIDMPGATGIDAARILRESAAAPVIVLLSMHMEDGLVEQAVAAGAMGFVYKLRARRDLAPAVRSALAGLLFLSPGSSR